MFLDMKKAIAAKDKKAVQELAVQQRKAGAAFLDCNVGTAASDQESAMRWLVESIQEATDTPIAVDSQKMNVVKAGLEAIDNSKGCLVNSCSGDENKLDVYIPMCLEKNASLIALTMTKEGVPQSVEKRVEIAATIIGKAAEYGMTSDRLFIDPIILPINVPGAQPQPGFILEALGQIRVMTDPPVHITCGLSNLSQGTAERSLINRTFLTMAVAVGLDSAIVDVLDKDLMDAWITAEMLLNRQIYSDSFLKAARMNM
jgi:5-methyltetrahydrofolate corrinoid/iron sulfur protein methyltransferase